MTKQEILESVGNIIAETLNIEKDIVTPELSIGSIPQWDSVGNLGIITAIEKQFKIEIPLEDLFDLTDVKSLVDEVEKIIQ